MGTATIAAITDFEVYLLMTMKRRLSMADMQDQLEAKLAEHGLSIGDAEHLHERVAEVLSDEALRFENMKRLLGIVGPDSTLLEYRSVMWRGFEFKATAAENGLLESAGYWHTTRDLSSRVSPGELSIWSVDVAEFAERFGPVVRRRKWPLFDKLLPAYEEYEFAWNGERYGVRFIWGLFISSSIHWE